jgi:hypothetical protein
LRSASITHTFLALAPSKSAHDLGESRGGIMIYLAVRKNFPANAAAVYGAITDMEALIKEHPETYRPQLLNQIWPNFDSLKDGIVRSRSASRRIPPTAVGGLFIRGLPRSALYFQEARKTGAAIYLENS